MTEQLRTSGPTPARQAAALAGFMAVTFLAAAVAGPSSAGTVDGWYASLRRPPGTPPNWVFPVVWTLLYCLMSVAAWRVWRLRGLADPAILLYLLQLLPNAAWTPLFFGLRRMDWAFADILLLLALVAATARMFAHRDAVAGRLMLPYLLWVGYASWLNLGYLFLNSEMP